MILFNESCPGGLWTFYLYAGQNFLEVDHSWLGCSNAVPCVHSPGDFGHLRYFPALLSASQGIQRGEYAINTPSSCSSCSWIKIFILMHFCDKEWAVLQHIQGQSFSPLHLPKVWFLLLVLWMVKLQHLGCVGFHCLLQETTLHCQVGARDNLIGDPSNVRDCIM